MMISSDVINRINEAIVDNATLFGFEYNGKEGNIDPFYSDGQNHFLLFFDGQEQTVNSVEEVFATPFVMGHTIFEIAEDMKITE